jgi:hypothetical protein
MTIRLTVPVDAPAAVLMVNWRPTVVCTEVTVATLFGAPITGADTAIRFIGALLMALFV